MRLLVTGSDGYIGTRLVRHLTQRGHEVLGVDAGLYVDGWLPLDGTVPPTMTRRDLRDLRDADLAGVDAVAHLAEVPDDVRDPTLTYEVNYHAALALARRAKRLRVTRFVYASSCRVYGDDDDGPRTEMSAVDPRTTYAECQVLVERGLGMLADARFSPTVLRVGTAFGPSPRMRFDVLLNRLAGLAHTTGQIRMTTDASRWLPLVHVLDVCRAFACVIEAPRVEVHNEVFNVGDDRQNHRVRDVAAFVGDAYPDCAVTFGALDADPGSCRVSFGKIAARLPGFACTHDPRRGAHDLAQWFQAIRLDRQTFESRPFTRSRHLDHLGATGRIDVHLRWRDAARTAVPMAA
jgi:nucleoside-diphosphate-sugar epimerase